MSEYGYLFGCILGAGYFYTYPTYDEILKHNKATIDALPGTIDLADDILIAKSIFKVSMPEDHNIYRFQMIPFALSINHLDIYWEDWLLQFEDLLKKLFWYEAYVYAAAENFMMLTDYYWKADLTPVGKRPPQPIETWTFVGGPRSLRRD